MLNDPIRRLRLIGWLEGSSYLLLLFVAMPLKYLADMPAVVSVVGMAHGILFIFYVLAAMAAWGARRLPVRGFALAVVAAVLPFGPFAFDRWVLGDDEA
jgi:integral membrane protein